MTPLDLGRLLTPLKMITNSKMNLILEFKRTQKMYDVVVCDNVTACIMQT